MKDIFIDNNIAKDFATPINPDYKELIRWLITYNNNEDDAYLVLSQKLMNEYIASSQSCFKSTAITLIVDKLTKEGRINSFENKEIKAFISTFYKAKVLKKLLSNHKDRFHIPIVVLSNRQIALTIDANFAHDLVNFPKSNVTVSDCPSKINYK
ncbi:hypothetical protein [Winogradskyella costae]|uniref:hypothetical protein n=1 Tax=Winogradskyella costae TaxID=2697008 RepID=UPI0015C9C48B|nr:hypothetical protein [Winogradskyella costae]